LTQVVAQVSLLATYLLVASSHYARKPVKAAIAQQLAREMLA
jgi:hypothetical protein